MVKSQYNLRSLDPFFIGFDRLWDEIERAHGGINLGKYPPYNIVHHDENNFTIEMAVAGFGEDEIEVQLQENELQITGTPNQPGVKGDDQMLHHGIANREFSRRFTLNADIEVQNCELKNGMLMIKLERVIPEEKKPKTIPINQKEAKGAPASALEQEFLTEE